MNKRLTVRCVRARETETDPIKRRFWENIINLLPHARLDGFQRALLEKNLTEASTRFRVTLICKCANDAAEGYGATVEEARTNAIKFFRKDHGKRAKWQSEITEHAVTTASGSSHYEELPS